MLFSFFMCSCIGENKAEDDDNSCVYGRAVYGECSYGE
jgi:hypothetical protein